MRRLKYVDRPHSIDVKGAFSLQNRAVLRGAQLLCLGMYCAFSTAQTMDPITLHYYERRPFQYTAEDNTPAGSIVDLERLVFKSAGIPVTWAQTPVNRIMRVLQDNRGLDCSAAWTQTPERELFAKFTNPIVDETFLVGLARSDLNATGDSKAKDVFALPSVKLVLKQGLTYGEYLDGLIANVPSNQKVIVSDDIASIARMISLSAGNVAIVNLDEAKTYISQGGKQVGELRILRFPDVPTLGPRSIMCSQSVPNDVITKLNAAIKRLPKPAR